MGVGGLRKPRVVTNHFFDFEKFRVYNLDQTITLPQMLFKILPYYYTNPKCKAAKVIYRQIFVFHYCISQDQRHLPDFVDEDLKFFTLLTLTFLNTQTSLCSDPFNESSMDFLRTL